MQGSGPTPCLYLPSSQGAQGPPFEPVNPATHSHLSKLPAPCSVVVVCTGQMVQVREVAWATPVEYVPGGHCEQGSGPRVLL